MPQPLAEMSWAAQRVALHMLKSEGHFLSNSGARSKHEAVSELEINGLLMPKALHDVEGYKLSLRGEHEARALAAHEAAHPPQQETDEKPKRARKRKDQR